LQYFVHSGTPLWCLLPRLTHALSSHQNESFEKDLQAALPDYADVFFDLAGGKVLDIALTVVARHGLISQCGAMDSE
jgi:NADPH-dependent curcumin reductase CurA